MFRFEGPLEVGGDAPTGVKALQLDASGNLKVAVTGAGSGGTSSVDESTFSAGTTAGTPAMGVYQASPAALTDGQLGIVALDANRNQLVNVAAGSLAFAPATSGGCADFHLVTAATTNANNVKASAGQLYGVHVFNNAAYPVFVKFHNTAGTPTPGSGVVFTVGVQAGTQRDVQSTFGIAFGTGIGLSVVQGITDADTTAVALNDAVIDVEYK